MATQTPATVSRFEAALAALLLLACAAVALRPSIRGNDGVGNYVFLESILCDGDLDFANDYARFDARRDYAFKFSELPKSPVTGRPSDRYGVGSALLWAPFVAPIHCALKIVAPDRADGATRPYEWGVGLASAFWGSLGLWLLYLRLRADCAVFPAAAAIAGLLFASPLGFYLYAHGSMSHAVGFFAATGLMLAFEQTWRRPAVVPAALCGAMAALLAITRFQDAPWAVLAGGALVWRFASADVSSRPKLFAAFAAAAIAVAFPQLAVWKVLYGAWLSGPLPYLDSTAGSFSGWPVHLFAALFSERHGALAWHPIIALGLVGLVGMALRGKHAESRDPLPLLGLTGFVALCWVVGSWSMWWAGASFGNRFFISALPYVALGLGEAFSCIERKLGRWLLAILLAALVVWNLGLLYQYATEMIPREDAVPWSQVIRQNAIDVPLRLIGRE